jgi:mannose-6-phosphate isomerase-like protein (cupin superfamily)
MTDETGAGHTDHTGPRDSTGAAPQIRRVRLAEKFALFSDQWSPKVVGRVNDMHVKISKLQGDFMWHAHEEEDEMFLVVKGELVIRLRDQDDVILKAGDFVVIPRGVEHFPTAEEEVQVLLIEPAETSNTGTAGGERTLTDLDHI